METKNYFSTDAAGNIIPGAQVYVNLPGTSSPAPGITNINGAPLANPFTAASSGLVQFKAPDGEYDLRVVGGGREFTIRIQCFDGAAFTASLPDMLVSENIKYVAAGEGAAEISVRDKLRNRVDVEDFYAEGEADDTDMIQRAIDAVFERGGGVVNLGPKIYNVSATKKTLPVILISAGGGLNPTTTLTQSCIVLRAGVLLVGAGRGTTVLLAPAIQRSVLTLYCMDGGGAMGITYDGGKGVTSAVSDLDDICGNYVLLEPEVRNSLSYGIGIQMGFSYNVKIVRPYVHNCAQDGIDFKARKRPSTGELPYGNSITEPLIESYGQTSTTESAGIDFRGQMHVIGGSIRKFSVPGKNNIGIRASTGVKEVNDKRVASYRSIVHGLYIESGNAADTGIVGIAVYESSHDCFSDVVVENCHTGVNVAATTTGNGRCDFLKITGVEVFGSRGNSFQTTEDRNSFMNCQAIAAEDYFSEGLDNLVPGQMSIFVPRTFLAASVRVYKNEALLVVGTNYTVSGTDTINLVTPAVTGDIFMIQTPGSRGFNFQTGAEGRSGTNGVVVGCVTKGMATPIDANALCKASLIEGLNQFEGCAFTMPYSATSAELQAAGPGADVEAELRSKGAAGVTARSNGARAGRFSNPASAVNWLDMLGSAASTPVTYGAAGSDTNIDVLIKPKGSSGRVRVGVLTASADAPITGYIEIKDAAGTLRKLAVIS